MVKHGNKKKSDIRHAVDVESLSEVILNIKSGLSSVIVTKHGYGRAGQIAIIVSEACVGAGINLPPCDIPIGIRPVNIAGVFYTWKPYRYQTGNDCDLAPVRILIEGCYRYNGVDSNGNAQLEALNHSVG